MDHLVRDAAGVQGAITVQGTRHGTHGKKKKSLAMAAEFAKRQASELNSLCHDLASFSGQEISKNTTMFVFSNDGAGGCN